MKPLTTALKFLLLLFFSAAGPTHAQAPEFSLKGQILGPGSQPVEGAMVHLLRAADTTLVKAEFSDGAGSYTFPNLRPDTYRLIVEHQEFASFQSPSFPLEASHTYEAIQLTERSSELEEVEIVVAKPFIEQHFDKTVLNVDKSISNAGNTALEVLEKAPGLVIDQNDNISMRGRSGVIVMINGKQVPMSGADLANMLRGLPSNSVDRIELITNPSAKYDAAGNAGIIDIKLKQDNKQGTNGSISSSIGQGRYFKTNQGIQLNHRQGKINIFGNYNYSFRKDFVDLDIFRQFYEGETRTGGYDQQNRFRFDIESHTARIGMDYDLSSQTILGLAAYGLFTTFDRDNNNQSLVLNAAQEPESSFFTTGASESSRPSGGINLNFIHSIDTTGREISGDLDYIRYANSEIQDYSTRYLDLEGEPFRNPYLLYGNIDGDLSIKSLKLDYSQPLSWIDGNLEAGVKSSLVKSENDLRFYDRSNGGNVLDENISNNFHYRENINAAYLNLNSKGEKFSYQLGLRLENTNAEGEQITTGETFTRDYTQFFPSGFVGYTPNDNHEFGLSLSRRINRPTYNQLNPFKTFLDPSTYSTGNPYLNPELSYALEFTHTWLQKFTMKYSYSRTEDVILNVLSLDPEQENVVVQQNLNLAKQDYYAFTLTAPFKIGNWFNSTNNATLYYSLYQGNLANTDLHDGRPAFNLNSNNAFRISDTWSAELIGIFRSSEIYGFLDVEPFWMLTAGVQKQFWEKQGSLKLTISDPFSTAKTRATTRLTGYSENFFQRRDSRVVNLSFTYRFGTQVAPARQRTGGAEEEKSRVQ